MSSVPRRKIIFVLTSFRGGGAERVLLNLLLSLDRQRFDPSLVVINDDGPLKALCPTDMPVHILNRSRALKAVFAIWRILQQQRPELVFSTIGYVNLLVVVICKFVTGRPQSVLREANLPSIALPLSPRPGLFKWLYRLIYPHADIVIATSACMAREFVEDIGVERERIRVLENPLQIGQLRSAVKTIRRMHAEQVSLVTVGRLVPQKGFERLIDAFARLPETFHLAIIGSGPLEARIRKLIEHHKLEQRVKLLGFQQIPWEWMAGADACLLPSRFEGMPNVALEALACGTPVIATPECGGLGELVDECPAITIADWPDVFFDAMRAVTANPTDIVRPSLLARRFDSSQVAARFEQILNAH